MLRQAALICCAILALGILGACSRDAASTYDLTIIMDPGAKTFGSTEQLIRQFEQEHHLRVRMLKAPADTTERLSQYLQYLGAASDDIDVYQVDVIWPAILQHHLADLTDAFTTETSHFFPAIIKNNTIDGRLIAIPWYADAGLLYYRADLLEKYGIAAPPATWDELTTMAAAIQAGERRDGNPNFWGYVWQGRAYEGLTCNAIEWQASSGGGTIVTSGGKADVNNQAFIRAVTRAAGWVGTISPRGVTTYAEEEARQMFQTGDVAFMRNWPYAYSLVNGEESPVRGRVKVALPPGGPGGRAVALGGWQLAVARYSRNPKAATELVRYLTSAHAQKFRALDASVLPTRTALYEDPDIAARFPFIPTMRQAFEQAVARPSSVTGQDYNEVSTYYFQYVHRVLTGQSAAAPAMQQLDELLTELLEP